MCVLSLLFVCLFTCFVIVPQFCKLETLHGDETETSTGLTFVHRHLHLASAVFLFALPQTFHNSSYNSIAMFCSCDLLQVSQSADPNSVPTTYDSWLIQIRNTTNLSRVPLISFCCHPCLSLSGLENDGSVLRSFTTGRVFPPSADLHLHNMVKGVVIPCLKV